VTTLPEEEGELVLADLPHSWHGLEAQLSDLLNPMATRVQAKPHWYKLVTTLRRLQVCRSRSRGNSYTACTTRLVRP
jgi:hypothetical protein